MAAVPASIQGSAGACRPNRHTATAVPTTAPNGVLATLYSGLQPARELAEDELVGVRPGAEELLWVAVVGHDAALLQALQRSLNLPDAALEALAEDSDMPRLRHFPGGFVIRVIACTFDPRLHVSGQVFHVLCADNLVLTLTGAAPPYLTRTLGRLRHEPGVGILGAESFAAGLLEAQLGTYFEAVSQLEARVDHLELDLLAGRTANALAVLSALRQATSRLRRLLASHRDTYDCLVRPDFRPRSDATVNEHLRALQARYERGLDLVEHSRDVVMGSFQLFSTQVAMSTNASMRILTFATVLLGLMAVIAGVLGMNFHPQFFDSGDRGFWIAVGGLSLMAACAMWLAHRLAWLRSA